MDVEFAYNKIFDLLENEDASINLLNSKAGIFFAPELYLVFQIGKLLKIHEQNIFNGKIEWMRETNFGNGGPTDFIFLQKGNLYLFEFKIASKSDLYISDIEKLKRMDIESVRKRKGFEEVTNIEKFFIAVVDVFSEQGKNDPRILKMTQNDNGLSQCVADFRMFKTKYDAYKKDNSCLVAMWLVE